MRSKNNDKQKAILLRKEGKSYSEILKLLNLTSKGTLSHWFKNIDLNDEEQKRLEKNMTLAAARGLKNFNDERSKNIVLENEKYREDGRKSVKKISANELFLIGVTLYWGEGTKAENKNSSKVLAFTNSDPDMITVYLRFIRNILKVDNSKITCGIHLYSTIDHQQAREYWSSVTKLSPEKFYIITQISRASQSIRPFNSLPFGTCVIKVSNRRYFYRMKGMIQGIIDNLKIS